MTDKELRELAEKATPGEWKLIIRGNSVQSHAVVCHDDSVSLNPQNICSGISPKTGNAAYIAAANPARIIELLDRVEKAEMVCEMLYQNTGIHCSAFGKCIGCGKESTPSLGMYCRKCIDKALMEWKEGAK